MNKTTFALIILATLFISLTNAQDEKKEIQDLQQSSSFNTLKWENGKTFACGDFELLGLQNNKSEQSLKKVYFNLDSHYELTISFDLYIIDQDLALQFQLKGSDKFLTYMDDATKSNICGNSSTFENVYHYTTTIQHNDDSFELSLTNLSNKFGNSWGIRNISITLSLCKFAGNLTCKKCIATTCVDCNPSQRLDEQGLCVCKEAYQLNGDSTDCVPVKVDEDFCNQQIKEQANLILVNPQSDSTDSTNLNLSVNFSFAKASIPQECFQYFSSSASVFNPQTYQQDNVLNYSHDNVNNKGTFQLAVNSLETYVQSGKISCNIYLTNPLNEILRIYTFSIIITVAPNNQINAMAINDDFSTNYECDVLQDNCSVITDLAIQATLCSDITCSAKRQNAVYQLGDTMYIFVSFKDSTFTKYLSNKYLALQNKEQILDYAEFTKTISQTLQGTVLAVELTTISEESTLLQIFMEIRLNPDGTRRMLKAVEDNKQTVAQVNNVIILQKTDVQQQIDVKNSQNSNLLISLWFAMIALMILI